MRFIPGFASPPQAVVHAILPIEGILCEEVGKVHHIRGTSAP